MNVTLIVTVFLSIFGSNLAVEIFKACREDHQEKKKNVTKADLKPIIDGLKELIGIELDRLFDEWSHSDVRTKEMWDKIEGLYKPYKGLKGNGTREKQYLECKDMPMT